MSGDKYSISPRSGRLKKKVRIKKKKKDFNIKTSILNIIKNPWVVLIVVVTFGFAVYKLMGETGRKSGNSPLMNAEDINKKVKEKKGR